MADQNYPLKPYTVNGWIISKSGEMWRAVNKFGEIGATSVVEDRVVTFAKTNKADKPIL